MKKLLLASLLAFLLVANPVFASKNNSKKSDDPAASPSVTATTTIIATVTEKCDPNAEWKNHGQYVSCVAHEHEGGSAVSDAAKSDVGKKSHGENEPSTTPSVSPSVSPTSSVTPSESVSPTVSPSVSPTESVTPSISISPGITHTSTGPGISGQQLSGILDAIKTFLNALFHIL